jgi:hypothetical protein
MRASLRAVAKAMKSNRAPETITQEPFDYDSGHYKRLCHLEGGQPSASDLIDYALDMTHMELQPELLRHLMPVLLNEWRRDLFEGQTAGLRGFVEYFEPALLRGKALQAILSDAERSVVRLFMRNTILDRLDIEDSLAFSGMEASPYQWVRAIASFGVIFPDIESFWTEWWQMKTCGHSVAAFQYASSLLYEQGKNPVFASWTRDKGGGPPVLWACGGHMYGVGWLEENLGFLRRTLSVEYIEQRLRVAQQMIKSAESNSVASRILADLPAQKNLLALRIEQLPTLFANVSNVDGFTI